MLSHNKTLDEPFYNTYQQGFVYKGEQDNVPNNGVNVQPRRETSVNFVHNRVGQTMAFRRDGDGASCRNTFESGKTSRTGQYNSVNPSVLHTPYGVGRTGLPCATNENKKDAIRIETLTRGRFALHGKVPPNNVGTSI